MQRDANVYKLNILGKAKFFFLGLTSICMSGLFLLSPSEITTPLWVNSIGGIFILIGFYLIILSFQYRIIFSKDAVTVVYPFSIRSLQRSEVKGRKYCHAYNGPSWHILLANNPSKTQLTILNDVGFNKEWEDWYLFLPDLDYPQKPKIYFKKNGKHTQDRRHP
jgi:hypothetical protein